MSASEELQQLALRFIDPIPHDHAVILVIVPADETIAEQSRVTGVDRDTVSQKARRLVHRGTFALVGQPATTEKRLHSYSDMVAGTILVLEEGHVIAAGSHRWCR